MVKIVADHQPVLVFTNENMDGYIHVSEVNIPPVRFICSPTRQVRTVSIKGSWDPERSVPLINKVVVSVEEALANIGMKTRNVVIHMHYDGEVFWVNFLGEVWPTQNLINGWIG